MPLTQIVPLLMVLVAVPAAVLAVVAYFGKRPRPKDQGYYEALIDTSWKDADRLRIDLEQERGRAQQLQRELNEERHRAGALVDDLQDELDRCKQRCAILQHKLSEAESDIGSLKRSLQRWLGRGGESGA